ncbi:MAG: sigma-54 dependent transcriptional regulator [Planctomycetes bacterium]|nr:sigma-54 dependent transcriptional regulator [Planctomycetota bacterium]
MVNRILVVDDDRPHAETVKDSLASDVREVDTAFSYPSALEALKKNPYDLVITDLVLHDKEGDGMDLLVFIRSMYPEVEVIIITGKGSTEKAVEAMEKGAASYLSKPLDVAELRVKCSRALEKRGLVKLTDELRKRVDDRYGLSSIIGDSLAMKRVAGAIRQVADTDATVLITGENGTGKEMVAAALHQLSRRKNKRFIPINCAAISENLLESELFGYEQGAFTDARSSREGKFEYASEGTLFLDEIGDMSLALQPKLLRVLEDGMVTRLGGNAPKKVDVRVIAATNQDLQAKMASNRFRQDLFFRLSVIVIQLPPLRERRDDVPLLCRHFLQTYAKEYQRKAPEITIPAMNKLVAYDWPGNVRELRNVIQNLTIMSNSQVIDVPELPPQIGGIEGVVAFASGPTGIEGLVGWKLDDLERKLIAATLESTDHNREKAAEMLGISERTLYRKINSYGLLRKRKSGDRGEGTGSRE